MAMRGQDILVLLKLLASAGRPWSYAQLAQELGMSASEVHAAIKRCAEAGLFNPHTRQPQRKALQEFLVHGLRYVFPAQPGALVQGLPTSHGAPPLNQRLRFDPHEVPVMPLAAGSTRGPEIRPLYRSAPLAASRDPQLYELLALADALRSGRARERKLAQEAIEEILSR
jgi:hypothetical protein